MSVQLLETTTARDERQRADASDRELHVHTTAAGRSIAYADGSIAAMDDAGQRAPTGDGRPEVYGDGDGWPTWDAEMWPAAISYGHCWVVPNGDGWAAWESIQD